MKNGAFVLGLIGGILGVISGLLMALMGDFASAVGVEGGALYSVAAWIGGFGGGVLALIGSIVAKNKKAGLVLSALGCAFIIAAVIIFGDFMVFPVISAIVIFIGFIMGLIANKRMK